MSTGTAVAKKPLRQVANVRELLVNTVAAEQIAAVSAKHMSPERLMRVTANAIRTTPKLQEADPLSFLGALMQCAALGLEPGTVLGHAFLVPFKNNRKGITEVQVIVGYKGLIDLARRSGHIRSISAHVHYSDDPVWVYREGADPKLEHEPGDQQGEKLHAYAVAHFREDRGGGFAHIVLPWSHVIRIRNGSQNWQTAVKFGKTADSPWSTHEDAMAKKTAIRALAKYLPLSVEFRDAVAVDHDAGSRADFSAFAMDPGSGVTIDGETVEPVTTGETDVPADNALAEGDQQQDAAPAPEQKPADPKPAAKKAPAKRDATPYAEQGQETKPAAPKEPDPEPEQQDDAPTEQPIPEDVQARLTQLVGDLAECKGEGEIGETMELFGDDIESWREGCPAAFHAAHQAADDARERTA